VELAADVLFWAIAIARCRLSAMATNHYNNSSHAAREVWKLTERRLK
jgi:hypothetical protein